MEVLVVKKYIGKKVLLILKNNYQYTVTIPYFDGSSFEVVDKYGDNVEIECDFINFIKEVRE